MKIDNSFDELSFSDITNKLVPLIDKQIEQTRNQIEDARELAESIAEKYYIWWKGNQKIKLATGSKTNNGKMHASVRTRSNNGKTYIVWVDQRYTPIKKVNPLWGKEISPTTRGYTKKQFSSYADTWELEAAWKTETLLKPLRESLDSLHANQINLLRIKRKIIKVQENDND